MTDATDHLDLLVIGGGVFGMSAARTAAERGTRVVVLERGPIPNPVAASYGPSRKIRSTYDDPHYATLAREAMGRWREIEASTRRTLYVASGNLVFTRLDDQPKLDELEAVSAQIGSPVQRIDGAELARRWPQFQGARRALLEPDAGFLRASECVSALRELAERAGARCVTDCEIVGLEDDYTGVRARSTDGRAFLAERAVVALGGWSKRLMPELNPTLTQSQQGLMYVLDAPSRFRHPEFPAFSCPDSGCYGFPAWGPDAMKVAQHILGEPIASPDFDRRTTPEGFVEVVEQFLRDVLGIDPRRHSVRAESCMYNLTPSSDFLIDMLPGSSRVIVATGGSGHGFKFGSVIGEVIIDRLDGRATTGWAPQMSWERVTSAVAGSVPR